MTLTEHLSAALQSALRRLSAARRALRTHRLRIVRLEADLEWAKGQQAAAETKANTVNVRVAEANKRAEEAWKRVRESETWRDEGAPAEVTRLRDLVRKLTQERDDLLARLETR